MAWLTKEERHALSLVLEPRLAKTAKGNPALQDLSLYSSELKNLKQVADAVLRVQEGTFGKLEDRTRTRYFRTLRIHGVVTGSPSAPALEPEAHILLDLLSKDDGSADYWRRHRDLVETPLFSALARKLVSENDKVQEQFKRVFWNAQLLLDFIPVSELGSVLEDLELIKMLQFVNSVGFEAARYFQLSSSERAAFKAAFSKVLKTGAAGPKNPSDEIESRAQEYFKATQSYQSDVRYRVAGFLTAFVNAKNAMGPDFPRMDRALKVVNMSSKLSEKSAASNSFGSSGPRLPHQLIVSGCPGSGKSHYIAELADSIGGSVYRTQFHSETSYYDFLGSYKPVPVFEEQKSEAPLKTMEGEPLPFGRPYINYQFVPGPLAMAVRDALLNPTRMVILIIEELNRGSCAAIFGDVFQLLDRSASGESRYGISLSVELENYFVGAGAISRADKLVLPKNFYIWATMNSADQGVYPLDSAFRRRWDFIYRGHAESCSYAESQRKITYGGLTYDWDDFRKVINAKLTTLGIHEDKLLGPYFFTVEQLASADAVLNKLLLYLWDDVMRFRQSEIFALGSFSEVQKHWQGGSGNPLILDFQAIPSNEISGLKT